MLDLYSLNIPVEQNGSIPLNNVKIAKGCSATHGAPSSVELNKSGIYMVAVSASITPTAAGDVSIGLARDGVLELGSSSVATAAADQTAALSFHSLIQVRDNNTCACNTSPTTIQLINTGEAGTAPIVKMTVTKVC